MSVTSVCCSSMRNFTLNMNFFWFANILVNHPFIILAGVSVFSCTCLVIPFTLKTIPDFSDPREGFETRGTVLSKRSTTWKNLEDAVHHSGPLAINPKQILESKQFNKREAGFLNHSNGKNESYVTVYVENETKTDLDRDRWKILHNFVNSDPSTDLSSFKTRVLTDDFFCGAPDEVYIRFVFESTDGSDLFTLDAIRNMCHLEQKLIKADHYKSLCVQTFTKPKRYCKPWSLGNYVAQLHNRTSCLTIKEEDVYDTKMLLNSCSQYFHDLGLGPNCYENKHCKVPRRCIQHNAVYNILNFITSISFLPPNKTSNMFLKQAMIFLPIAGSTATLPYYHTLEEMDLEYNGISVVAMDLGIKNILFDQFLKKDIWLMSVGGLFILMCIWFYTKSLFLTIMTIIAIIFSLGISYFIYTIIFEIHFFPFMNCLAIVVVIGIGADDVFIFCEAWNTARKQKGWTTVQVMNDTLKHAFTSMLITSLTTYAAFLASFISKITTVRCFSIFAATTVLVNFLLMMCWLPASMVVYESYKDCPLFKRFDCFPDISKWKIWKKVSSKILVGLTNLLMKLWNNRKQIIVDAVIRFRILWLISLTTTTIFSGIVVFYYPKLQLPTNSEFQLFDSSHPFEKYDSIYKNMFAFSRADKSSDNTNMMNYKLPLRFVWGVLPVDNGDYMDPKSLGELEFDPNFDISREDSQEWLLEFCRALRKQPFYKSTLGPLLPNCFIESFISLMQRRCVDTIDNIDRTPCCESSKFPFSPNVFNTCIVPIMSAMFETPSQYFIPGMAGPKFSKDDFPAIKAIVVEYDSIYDYSFSYKQMHNFVYTVEAWTLKQLKNAPISMQGGWFVSDFEFYDLQSILSEATIGAITVSMSLALVVLVLISLNVVTSFYAILTILSSIIVTVAVLVLLKWELNVLESIAISTAIGLTVDFSLHYTVYYGFYPMSENRRAATRYTLICMTGSTFMAAVTTGAAGAFMMPSSILPYMRIGVFLITVMTISWVYATFFMCSLLAVAGPENNFGKFHYEMLCCKTNSTFKNSMMAKHVSSSSTEGHELSVCNSKSGLTAVAVSDDPLEGPSVSDDPLEGPSTSGIYD